MTQVIPDKIWEEFYIELEKQKQLRKDGKFPESMDKRECYNIGWNDAIDEYEKELKKLRKIIQ